MVERESDEARRAREQKESAARNVREAAGYFKSALDSMPFGYSHSFGPDGITIYTEYRSPKFEDRLEIFCKKLNEWCEQRRTPPIEVRVVQEPNKAGLERRGIAVPGE